MYRQASVFKDVAPFYLPELQTAVVVICVILAKTPRSPSTVTARSGSGNMLEEERGELIEMSSNLDAPTTTRTSSLALSTLREEVRTRGGYRPLAVGATRLARTSPMSVISTLPFTENSSIVMS